MLYKYIRCWELYSRVRISPRFPWDHWTTRIRWCIGLPPKGTNPRRKMLPSGKLPLHIAIYRFYMRFTCQKLVVRLLESYDWNYGSPSHGTSSKGASCAQRVEPKICALQQRGLRCTALHGRDPTGNPAVGTRSKGPGQGTATNRTGRPWCGT